MKKFTGLLLMACIFSTAAFAQEERQHKYEPFDMLIGINVGAGFGVGGRIFKPAKKTNTSSGYGYEDTTDLALGNGYIMGSTDTGLTYDFYIFNWLSVNTGLFVNMERDI
jgi:hypothetical protein